MASYSGNIFMVVAPSGAGKSSLVNALLAQEPDVMLSISCTTRAPRSGERENQHYRFIDKEDFVRMREDGALLEWAEVHGNFYGTPRDRIDEAIGQGRDVLLEIDWQGAAQVRRLMPDSVHIFILPPSIAALRERLTKRAQDPPAVIEQRLVAAREEMRHCGEFDYVIMNQDFARAVDDLSAIVRAARLTTPRQQVRHAKALAALLNPES
jgi:guanylate kinase